MAPPAAFSRTPLLVDDEMDYQAIGQYMFVVVNAIANLVDDLNPGSGIPLLPIANSTANVLTSSLSSSSASSRSLLTSNTTTTTTATAPGAHPDVARRKKRTVYNHRGVRLRLKSIYFGPNPKENSRRPIGLPLSDSGRSTTTSRKQMGTISFSLFV
jgi:hypothetical protein